MEKRRVLLVLDATVLALFVSLLSWRLTGLTLHEVIGVALIAFMAAHVGVHWGWMERRTVLVLRRAPQRVGELLVNVGLFVTMGATLISGVVISKVVFPNTLTPAAYLGWHSLHESATTLTLVFTGLHFAINWERIVTLVQRGTTRAIAWRATSHGTILRRAVWLVAAVVALDVALWTYERIVPAAGKVLIVYRDGRRELRAPPPEITRYNADSDTRRPAGGTARLAFSMLLIAGSAGIGRRVAAARRRAPA